MPSTKPKFTVRFETKAELAKIRKAAKIMDVSVNKFIRREAILKADGFLVNRAGVLEKVPQTGTEA